MTLDEILVLEQKGFEGFDLTKEERVELHKLTFDKNIKGEAMINCKYVLQSFERMKEYSKDFSGLKEAYELALNHLHVLFS